MNPYIDLFIYKYSIENLLINKDKEIVYKVVNIVSLFKINFTTKLPPHLYLTLGDFEKILKLSVAKC